MDIVAQAKNMRAILYLKEEDEEFLKFVLKYNRRRSVGIPDFLKIGAEGKSFILLELPQKLKNFYIKLKEEEKIIFLSMLYIAPIITKPSYLEHFENNEILPIYAKEELDIREGLRHIRIAEYSMLDYRLTNENDVKKYVSKDIRRFWRIINGEVKVGMYCCIDIPNKIRDFVRGYSIVLGIRIDKKN